MDFYFYLGYSPSIIITFLNSAGAHVTCLHLCSYNRLPATLPALQSFFSNPPCLHRQRAQFRPGKWFARRSSMAPTACWCKYELCNLEFRDCHKITPIQHSLSFFAFHPQPWPTIALSYLEGGPLPRLPCPVCSSSGEPSVRLSS